MRRSFWIVFWPWAIALVPVDALPQPAARAPVAIRATFSGVAPTTIVVGDAAAHHALHWLSGESVEAAVDEGGVLSSSPVHLVMSCDVERRFGRCEGYASIRLADGERVLAKFSVALERPAGDAESLANAEFHGSWVAVSAPGPYRLASGGGSVRGGFSSAEACHADWRGELSRAAAAPSAR